MPSSSKNHGRSESTDSLRGDSSAELGLRPARFSPEPFEWVGGGRGGARVSELEKQMIVGRAYLPADEESSMGWDEVVEEGQDGIRKTVRIEQTS